MRVSRGRRRPRARCDGRRSLHVFVAATPSGTGNRKHVHVLSTKPQATRSHNHRGQPHCILDASVKRGTAAAARTALATCHCSLYQCYSSKESHAAIISRPPMGVMAPRTLIRLSTSAYSDPENRTTPASRSQPDSDGRGASGIIRNSCIVLRSVVSYSMQRQQQR